MPRRASAPRRYGYSALTDPTRRHTNLSVIQLKKPAFLDNEELAVLETMAGRFIERHATPEDVGRWRANGCVERELWLKAGGAGLLGVSVPAEYGGGGGDFRHEVVLMEQLGLRGVQGFALPLHNAVVAPYIVSYGTEAQKKKWLPKVVSGETVLAVAMTEPGAGSDLQGMKTTARRDGDHYVINGQKTFITNGLHASLVVVACKTSHDEGGKGI